MFAGIHTSLSESPLRFVAAMLLVGAFAVPATLLLLVVLPEISHTLAGVMGGIIAPVLTAPLMWVLVVRPMREDLATQAARFGSLLEAAPDGIVGVDATGRIEIVNVELLRLFGYSRDELIGRPIETLIPARFADEHAARREAYARDPAQSRRMDSSLSVDGLRSDGREIPLEVTLSHLHTRNGIQVVAIIRDVAVKREAALALHQTNQQLQEGMKNLQRRESVLRRLGEMGDMLQSCASEAEAFGVIAKFAEQLFPADSGLLYLTGASRNVLELQARWGPDAGSPPKLFPPTGCWAMRRGRMHVVGDVGARVDCDHIDASSGLSYLCMPLVAQGETMGIVHLIETSENRELTEEGRQVALGQKQRLLITMSEQVGLALANLRLREALRYQSIRDPLTGLFNRRFLNEWLDRELHRAAREETALALLMLDLDHFRRFNDSFGHDGGDAVLREVSKVLQEELRSGDIACRLGGEEFAVLAPGTTAADAVILAERIRRRVESLLVVANGQSLGSATVSIGIAAFPNDGLAAEHLMRAADQALYSAKGNGRNRVEVALAIAEPVVEAVAP